MNKLILAFAFAVAVTCVGFFFWAPAPAPAFPPAGLAPLALAPTIAPVSNPDRSAPAVASQPARQTPAVQIRESKPVASAARVDVAPAVGEAPARSIPAAADSGNGREESPIQSPHVSQAPRAQPNVPAAFQPPAAVPPLPAIIELEVPSGGKLPLALVESGEALSDGQLAAVDATATDFVRSVAGAKPGPAGKLRSPNEIWSQARQHADARYRLLFGNQAADLAAARAAAEAAAATSNAR